jgi:CBS domain-containing protein
VQYEVSKLLEDSHASSLLATNTGEIHFLWQDQLLFDALRQLMEWKVLSAPVLNDQGDDIFVVSIAGIMNRFLDVVSESDLRSGNLSSFKNVPLSQLAGIEECDPAVAVRWDASLKEVVEKMTAKRAHRALVYGKNEEISNILTQSRVVEFLSAALDFLPVMQYVPFDLVYCQQIH